MLQKQLHFESNEENIIFLRINLQNLHQTVVVLSIKYLCINEPLKKVCMELKTHDKDATTC